MQLFRTFLEVRSRGISLVFRLCPKGYAAVMGSPMPSWKEEDEAPDDCDCSENPYECHCKRCQALLIDFESGSGV